MAVLRAVTLVTDVSIFALNLTVAMGLALAIDYTLLIISRYRDELADGAEPRAGAGAHDGDGGPDRAVLGDDGRAVDGRDGAVPDVLPEVVRLRRHRRGGLRGRRRDRGGARGDRAARRPAGLAGRAPAGPPDPRPARAGATPVEQTFWYRSTKFVMRRSIPIGLAIIALLLVLGAPFLGIRWGFPDDRVLPRRRRRVRSATSCAPTSPSTPRRNVTVVIPDTTGITPAELDRYAAQLSQVADVSSVSAPGGTFVDGAPAGPPSAATGIKDGSAFLTVGSNAPLFSPASESQLDRLHAVSTPAGQPVQLTGVAQINRDSSRRSPPGCRWCSA